MKSFKHHIIESTTLQDLIKNYDNPFEFLAAAMDAMKSGKLNLKKRGAANARELVRAWNKAKQKKINIPEAVEYLIAEAKFAAIPTGQRKMITVRGLEGPSASNLLQYLKNSSHKAIRFLVLSNGRMLVWNANDALHDWIQTGEDLGLDVLRGEMRIKDGKLVVKHSKKRGDYAKKNRTLMDIKKTEKPEWFTTGSLL
jgi:hypothetical protein